MDLALKGKKVVVTGGSSGIGKAIVKAFKDEGADVFIIDQKLGIDASDEEEVKSFNKKIGDIDILINNAGIVRVNEFENQELQEWEDLIKNNLLSAFVCSKVFGKGMIANKKGKIINIVSTDAFVGNDQRSELGVKYVVAYASTKGALLTFTKALAVEWAKYNINVNGIAPSLVETESSKELFEDKEKVKEYENALPIHIIPSVEDIAALVLFLASEKSDKITGQVMPVDSGYLLI